ncbi:MAG: hypothetical protein K9N09_10040 [Candidatus Cloacimonetes bacterium]|nr:hypothetical protein [Candidatus Cloacimonadota bacterium]MCF7814457.1 hypothetical protein [Candidatus Cloacimonadota bacterium]MCF7869032.1 hypothetical protein [Candidatus Cloacimonadota bacterium]MCF7884427.1 hypothetical protein [Candidatus Cloacimonadota bacterium]
MKKTLTFILLTFSLFTYLFSEDTISVDLPKIAAVELQPYTNFDYDKIDESSAIIKSRMWNDVYWTLNDSGGKNMIFPFNRKGELLRAEWYKEYQGGVYLAGTMNIDWEEMAVDNDGNIYVCDSGNNGNARRDLAVYMLKDPNPEFSGTVNYLKKMHFYYPEQTQYPAVPNNFDCEAVFWANGKLYFLTKHRADSLTRLYRMDSMNANIENPLTYLATFDINGMVTAADVTPDGKNLAVLTYDNVWIFSVEEGDDYFNGTIKYLPIKAKQCEAICFADEETLIITNEQTELFELKISDMIDVK